MAIRLPLESFKIPISIKKKLGILDTHTSLYFKIVSISGDKNSLSLSLGCFPFIDGGDLSEVSLTNPCIYTLDYTFTPALVGTNFIEQGYVFLKTLPEYKDCIDC